MGLRKRSENKELGAFGVRVKACVGLFDLVNAPVFQRWDVTKYFYSIIVLKVDFQVYSVFIFLFTSKRNHTSESS